MKTSFLLMAYGRVSMLSLLFLAMNSGWAQKRQAENKSDLLPEMPAKIYNRLAPIMVKIICGEGDEVTGSGVVIGLTPSGRVVILTACHVVARNFRESDPDIPLQFHDRIKMRIGLDSAFAPAVLISKPRDRATDVALLATRVTVSQKELIRYDYSRGVKPGKKVAAFGFPGTEKLRQTVGRIIERDEKYLVFDAAIEEGNSGGPLVDDAGRMIGMCVFYEGITKAKGYAVSMDFILSVTDDWLKKIRVEEIWQRQKYVSVWQRMYRDPKILAPGLAMMGGGGYLLFKPPPKEETLFGDPPPPPSHHNY